MNVLLGLCDEKVTDGRETSYSVNKIGGQPDWPPGVGPGLGPGLGPPGVAPDVVDPEPRCGVCGEELYLVTQIYCPLHTSSDHRTLYVFSCRHTACSQHGNSLNWKVLRSQYLDSSCKSQIPSGSAIPSGSDSRMQGNEADMWGEADDDWGNDDDVEDCTENGVDVTQTEHYSGDEPLPDLEQMTLEDDESSTSESECIAEDLPLDTYRDNILKGLRQADIAHNITVTPPPHNITVTPQPHNITVTPPPHDKPPQSQDRALQSQDRAPQSQDRALQSQDRALQSQDRALQSQDRALQSQDRALQSQDRALQSQYKALCCYYMNVFDEPGDCECADSLQHEHDLLNDYLSRENVDLSHMSTSSSGGGGERYEKTMVRHGDHNYHKFHKRLTRCPQQIIRYSHRGEPLSIQSDTVPPGVCSYCGTQRVFECQLMPALINWLHFTPDSEPVIEFGTVQIYTCGATCWEDQATIREEFIVVQPDPDHKLLKSL